MSLGVWECASLGVYECGSLGSYGVLGSPMSNTTNGTNTTREIQISKVK